MIDFFFSWPKGEVWGNIIASAIWSLPVVLYTRYHTRKLHSKLDKLNAHTALINSKLKKGKK